MLERLERLENYRLNTFFLFSEHIEVAGMSGAHNQEHLETKTESSQLGAMKLLKKKNRLVYINLHEKKDFSAEAKKAGIEYHWLATPDFAQTLIPVATFDKIYDIVKIASQCGKQVTISCGAGTGRTGTALASLKLRELIENEFRTNVTPKGKAKATELFDINFESVPCTPLVKQAIEIIRERRITGSDPDEIWNGYKSVETRNDLLSLINYETHLRKKFSSALKIKYNLFASPLWGPYLYAGPHPIHLAYQGVSTGNLMGLRDRGVTKIYSLEKKGCKDLRATWSSFGQTFQHLTEENGVSYLIEDFRAPSLEQLCEISQSMLASIQAKEKIYLHCKGGMGRTGTILAALYMRTTGVLAEDAIHFVRKNYGKASVETKEQVESLMRFGRFLNLKTLEEESCLRIKRLKFQINQLSPKHQSNVNAVLKDIQDEKIPKEIAYEVLVQTTLLLRPEFHTSDYIEKYKQMADTVYGHPSKACKRLGLAMYALAAVAAVILIGLVSAGTLGLGIPVLGGGIVASLFPSYSFYKRGTSRYGLSDSMDKLASTCFENLVLQF